MNEPKKKRGFNIWRFGELVKAALMFGLGIFIWYDLRPHSLEPIEYGIMAMFFALGILCLRQAASATYDDPEPLDPAA